MSLKKFTYNQTLALENGQTIAGLQLAYHSFGQLNPQKNNVVWVFHALTANSNPAEWWPGLVGKGKLFDPSNYFIICVNVPGSCYGSTSPLEVNAATGEQWLHDFPFFTTRDIIRAFDHLRIALGINQIFLGIGGSLGGQQLLQWAVEAPDLFVHIVPIATNAKHSAWGIAFNASQRMAIEADSSWKEKQPDAGAAGLAVARSIALLSYRHYDAYGQTQTDADGRLQDYKSESYQRYQGEKLVKRFNAFSYYALTQTMDAHDLGRGRASIISALQSVKAKTLVIGITSDVLYPIAEQAFLAAHIPNAAFKTIESSYGHDGFLLEYAALEKLIAEFLTLHGSQRQVSLYQLV
jgi:homoserine O-acetyltransferase/O-succinyltransferase